MITFSSPKCKMDDRFAHIKYSSQIVNGYTLSVLYKRWCFKIVSQNIAGYLKYRWTSTRPVCTQLNKYFMPTPKMVVTFQNLSI